MTGIISFIIKVSDSHSYLSDLIVDSARKQSAYNYRKEYSANGISFTRKIILSSYIRFWF